MAVTIDSMQINLKEAPPPASAPPSKAKPEQQIDLRSALEMLHERKFRLQAD